jgi:hypothetical protein
MQALSQADIDFINLKNIEEVILACGYDSNSGKLIYIDNSKNIFEVQLESFFKHKLAIVRAYPINLGKQVEFDLQHAIVEVDTADLTQSGESVDLSQFSIDM